MKFKRFKCVVAGILKDMGIFRPKLLLHPGRGDPFNRVSQKLAKGKLGILKTDEISGKVTPGRKIDDCEGVSLLCFRGSEEPDAVIIKTSRRTFPEVNYRYPTIAIDLSKFDLLLPHERKSLMLQIGLSFGVVKDFFTEENFAVISAGREARREIARSFHPDIPFPITDLKEGERDIIVLDPSGDAEFTHEEVTPDTVIVIGGIVDTGERLQGATEEIFKNSKHRKIAVKGYESIVPDRINEITKIVCEYLTENITLEEAVRRNLTRDAKLRWLRKEIQKSLVRFLVDKSVIKGIPYDKYKEWQEEFGISDFLFKKSSRHVNGFVVFDPSLLKRVKGIVRKKRKKFLVLEDIKDEDIIKVYP